MARLPVLSAQQQIADTKTGKPTSQFKRFMDQSRETQEATDALQNEMIAALQANTQAAQAAQQTANQALEVADAAAGGGVVQSGSATQTVDASGEVWIEGPLVALTGVSAGDLTISGSGPQQTSNVAMIGNPRTATTSFRIMEIVSGVETMVFLGSFSAAAPGALDTATITNLSNGAVAAFSSARSSTGAVDYRLDVQAIGSPEIVNLSLYLFVRRA